MEIHPNLEAAKASAIVLRGITDSYRDDPEKFVLTSYRSDPMGDPVSIDPPQRRILRAVAEHDRVAVRSAHGVGKTTSAAWLAHWWLVTRRPSLVIVMAGAWPHLENRLWPELRLWANNWRWKEAFKWLDPQTGIRLDTPDPNAQVLQRITASSSDIPENVEGFHSPNLLLIIDEAKALPDAVWIAIRGALTTKLTAHSVPPKVVILSTPPVSPAGWYPDLFGTASKGWFTIHISAEDSPRVSKEYAQDIERDYGRKSAYYQAKVLGDIPDASAEVVIQRSWVTTAQEQPTAKDRKRPVVTVDVARSGEDLTAVGVIMNSKHYIADWEATSTTVTVANKAREVVKAVKAGILCIDDTGVGGGVTDLLIAQQRQGEFPEDCTIIPVVFAEKPADEKRFKQLKDELWWWTRNALQRHRIALQSDQELLALRNSQGGSIPFGSDFKKQLLSPIYEVEPIMDRIKVWDHRKSTDHREFLRALPTKSPDLAHTLVIGAKYYLQQADALFDANEKPESAANREFWDRMRRQKYGEADEAGAEYGYSERYRQFDDGKGGGL